MGLLSMSVIRMFLELTDLKFRKHLYRMKHG